MPKFAIIIGLLLIAVGVIGFLPQQAKTALVPAYVGVVLLALGLLASWKPSIRKHVMHLAAVVGLLGTLAPIGALVARWGQASALAVGINVAMGVLCGVFVFLCVQSFREGRKNRVA